MITVGVTTFNRRDIVATAISSALDFTRQFGGNVVCVDDGSSDGTVPEITARFSGPIAAGALKIVSHPLNQGVTAAKNTAFDLAGGADWVLFLDSDDQLISQSALEVAQVLENCRDAPVVFFRCIDQDGRFVGRPYSTQQRLTLERYAAHTSYGESLVAINKKLSAMPPFDADLRGYEGLGCIRLIGQFGPAVLSTVVARRYNRSRSDRLSSLGNMLARASLLARGHLRYLSVAGPHIHWRQKLALRFKAMVYFVAGRCYALSQLCRNPTRSPF